MNSLAERVPMDQQDTGVSRIDEKQFSVWGTVKQTSQQEITLSVRGESVAIGLDAKTLYQSRPRRFDSGLTGQEMFALYKRLSREEITIGMEVSVLVIVDDTVRVVATLVDAIR
jgi:hypothetical protein